MGETLIRVCGERSFDVVHLDTGLLAQYADSVQSLPAVIAPHDCMTLVLHELARVAPDPLRRFFFRHQGGKMRRYESWFYPQFQMCWVVSHVDRQYLAGFLSDENLAVIPYGVDTDHFAPQKRETARPCIGFVGVMDYPPNNDAALFFARQVLPLIWRKCPEVGFTVIGRNPGPQVKELVADERIIVTGAVENNDVRPWIAAQTIMVAPVRAQGGNKNKVFEALAMGKATVCTPVCTEGLDLVDGRHLWVGSSPAALAECCIRLIRNDHLREQLEQNGRAWALDHSWSEIAKRAEDLYLKTIEKYRVRSYSR
jgi:glycosyltransferase involved in cell wall biosynthesis